MQTRKTILPLLAIFVLGLAPFSYGQFAPKSHATHRTLGYYDPATGKFEPLAPEQDSDAPPVVATTGTLVFKFTVTVKSTLPKNSVIGCTADASISDSAFNGDEHGSGVAKLLSGDTYSCTVTIPYSWPLSSAGTDSIFLDSSASIDYGFQITATNGATTAIEPIEARDASHSLASIKVPATGATTTETIAITL
jgi:hypothetical protein